MRVYAQISTKQAVFGDGSLATVTGRVRYNNPTTNTGLNIYSGTTLVGTVNIWDEPASIIDDGVTAVLSPMDGQYKGKPAKFSVTFTRMGNLYSDEVDIAITDPNGVGLATLHKPSGVDNALILVF